VILFDRVNMTGRPTRLRVKKEALSDRVTLFLIRPANRSHSKRPADHFHTKEQAVNRVAGPWASERRLRAHNLYP